MNEQIEIQKADELVALLGLKEARDDNRKRYTPPRYDTKAGNKTALGLFRMLRAFMVEAQALRPAQIATVEVVSSKPDMYGNSYTYFVYNDNATGKSVSGYCSAANNVSTIAHHIAGGTEQGALNFINKELPIRVFNREVKGIVYAGCTGEQLVAFIEAELKKA